MIDVKRYNHEEKVNKRTGQITPAYYECFYYYKGYELAWYNSREDILRVNTKYISHDKTTEYKRALNSAMYSDAYKYLFDMLNVDKDTNMSEYMNM